jgi:class 3 adenylate cyclase
MIKKIVLSKKAKKDLMKISYLLCVPIYTMLIYLPFSDLYLAVFGNVVKYGVLSSHPVHEMMMKSQFFTLLIMLLLVYIWMSPFRKFSKKPTVELRNEIREKIKKRYTSILMLFGSTFILTVIFCALTGNLPEGMFLKQALPAITLSFVSQLAIFLVYIDSSIYKVPSFMETLYQGEDLFISKKGFSIPLYIKISLLIIVCSIIPYLLLILAVNAKIPSEIYSETFVRVAIICMFMLLLGLGFIFDGLQQPLDGLIKKMRKVSEGNYDVKTKIYFSDEVAKLKLGFNEMLDGLKEREEIKGTFGKYMSIEIARELLKSGKVKLGGEEIQAAVMFCDIRNFTPLSEKLTPPEVVSFLNDYFSYITPAISAHNGVISKFIGDAVMVIYTPALGSTDYAADALRSAIGMRKALTEFNTSGKAPGEVRFGIGIQNGGLVAGNIGTTARLEYTFIGDTVNIASRLESKTKELGTDILITKSVMSEAKKENSHINFESVGQVELKGKSKPLELYKVL